MQDTSTTFIKFTTFAYKSFFVLFYYYIYNLGFPQYNYKFSLKKSQYTSFFSVNICDEHCKYTQSKNSDDTTLAKFLLQSVQWLNKKHSKSTLDIKVAVKSSVEIFTVQGSAETNEIATCIFLEFESLLTVCRMFDEAFHILLFAQA